VKGRVAWWFVIAKAELRVNLFEATTDKGIGTVASQKIKAWEWYAGITAVSKHA